MEKNYNYQEKFLFHVLNILLTGIITISNPAIEYKSCFHRQIILTCFPSGKID